MSISSPLDDFIERIVREVIRRLHAESVKTSNANVINDRLITAAMIQSLPTGACEVTIAKRAIVTPLARDEARDRGIKIRREEQGTKP